MTIVKKLEFQYKIKNKLINKFKKYWKIIILNGNKWYMIKLQIWKSILRNILVQFMD